MSSKTTVKEYMDYSSFHGIGRTKNAPYLFLKVFWVLALCGSAGMIIWQIRDLYDKYKSYPISTSIEVKTASALEFPNVVICNTNPLMYGSFPEDSALQDVITEAANEYGIDLNMFTSDIYGYNFTTFDQSTNTYISHDILLKTAEQFKMHMSVMSDNRLLEISQPKDEFIVHCNFAGEECSPEAIVPIRTFSQGICYIFKPKLQGSIAPHGMVSAVGPRYSLEMVLHTDESESVPFVTSSSGAIIGITLEDKYFHEEKSAFVPTGFATNIAISQMRKDSVPGKKKVKRCKTSGNGTTTLLDCRRNCTQQDIANHCGCYQFFFDFGVINDSLLLNDTHKSYGWRPCHTKKDYTCIQERLVAYIKEPPKLCNKCLSPCHEVVYDKVVSMVSWPNENYIPLLRRIMQTRLNSDMGDLDREFVRDNLALVRIYLSSLSYQHVKEDYTYSEVDFISDIGGQLGLWIGCSVLSVFEVVELIVLLVASVRAKKTSPEDQESQEEKEDVKAY